MNALGVITIHSPMRSAYNAVCMFVIQGARFEQTRAYLCVAGDEAYFIQQK